MEVDTDATFGALLRMQPALRAAREAHEDVVSLAVDLIGLSRSGRREDRFERATAAFDAAVMALGLATLEHLPLAWASVPPEVVARTYSRLSEGPAEMRPTSPAAASAPAAPRPRAEAEAAKDAALATTGDLPLATAAALVGALAEALEPASSAEPVAVGVLATVPAVPAQRAPALPSGALDLRGQYVDPDEDSMVEWPTEDPGPVGTPPRAAAVTPSRAVAALTPEVMEALRDRLSAGAAPVAPSAGETSKLSALEALQALPPVPTRIEDEAAFAEEYRRLQSCADPARLDGLGALDVVPQARVLHYLAARIHRLEREVPAALRPTFVAGDNAYRSLMKALSHQMAVLRQRQPKIEPLRLAPRQRDWLREAEVLEGAVRAEVAAAVGGAAPPVPPTSPGMPFNLERALDDLARAVDENVATPELTAQVKALLLAGAAPDDPRLCGVLAERITELTAPRFKTLRAKVRRFTKALAEEEASPEPWPIATDLAGKRVLLVGGDRTSGLLARLRIRLPGVEIDWVETSQTCGIRQVQAAGDRVQQGSVDLLLLIQRFVSHTVSDVLAAATKVANIPFLKVKRGYGLSQVRAVLEASCGA